MERADSWMSGLSGHLRFPGTPDCILDVCSADTWKSSGQFAEYGAVPLIVCIGGSPVAAMQLSRSRSVRASEDFLEILMPDIAQIKEHMDVISSDRKTVGKVDHLNGADKIKLTKQSSPDGQHHHFIPVSWIDHVDQHVHLNKTGADVTAHWQHEGRT